MNGTVIKKGAVLTMAVTARASDNVALKQIDVKADGVSIGVIPCSGKTCSGSVNWKVSSLAAGVHTLTAVATDTAGNSRESLPTTVFK